jgi:Xaa-Pro aminopeptidase
MSHDIRPAWSGRLAALQALLGEQSLDALVVSAAPNVVYLTGFTGSSHLVLVTPARVTLITDGRYAFVVRQGLGDGSLAEVDLEVVANRYDVTLGQTVASQKLKRVGFEAGHVTVATLQSWQRAAPDITWLPTERVVENLRLIKDALEIEIFRRGAALISGVASELARHVRRGMTERQVAAEIDDAVVGAGFSGPSFATIVASGPNSAHPHAHPGERKLSPGDLVVLDFGGVLDGYCVDLTRMATVGPARPEAQALFDGVLAAHGAAVRAVRPGVATSAVDEAARSELGARGLGEAFLHSTGHGLGLEIHEAPRIARAETQSNELVREGMVFTIEPGAYVDGVGGVRLEDDVLVTAEGCDVLTTTSRDLLVV